MGLYNILPDYIHEVDVIVAGGGTAGCVIAARITEDDPNLSVLLIEQGMDNQNVPEVIYPALFARNIQPGSKTALFWKGIKAPQLAGREPVVPSGGILGGGSSINWMVYTRAQRTDFDSWNTPGWTADELWPFLNKFETYHGRGEKEHHGHDGPIHVSSGTYRSTVAENAFINAAAALGYPEFADLQNLDSNDGTERWYRYVSPNDGRRQDTAHRYLHPKLQDPYQYPNLHVLVESQVARILFDDNKRAVGVEFQPNPMFQDEGVAGLGRTVSARKMVVLSAGACGSPLVLERSGIGKSKVLERAGVPLVMDLPGVGNEYQDHHLVLYPYRTSLGPRETINGIASGRSDVQAMMTNNDELLGWNSMDASGKFRPMEKDIEALDEHFQEAWKRDFENAPNRPLIITAMYSCFFEDAKTLPDHAEYISIANWTAYPYSRGYIHITGPDPNDPIDFDVGYLNDPGDVDLQKHIWAYKNQRAIMRRMSIFRGEPGLYHPKFPTGSAAACIEKTDGPLLRVEDLDIKYTKEDDAAIAQFVRENVGTTWHSLGTCKMAPREKGGVVDPQLNVHGVRGLKVADLSIPPENVGANTNNTALMIGEKAADIIVRELRMSQQYLKVK